MKSSLKSTFFHFCKNQILAIRELIKKSFSVFIRPLLPPTGDLFVKKGKRISLTALGKRYTQASTGTMVFILITFLWLQSHFFAPFDSEIDAIQSINKFSQWNETSLKNRPDILLIDTDGAFEITQPKDIIERSQVLTDRAILLKLMQNLLKYQDKFKVIGLDIILDKPSNRPQIDESLRITLKQLAQKQKIVLASAFNVNLLTQDKQLPIYGLHPSDFGYVTYHNMDNRFYKYRFMENEKNKSFPLQLYERVTEKKMHEAFGGVYHHIAGVWTLNQVIPEWYKLSIKAVPIKIAQDSTLFKTILKDKDAKRLMILVGNFNDPNNLNSHIDLHETINGKWVGSSVLLNLYFNLQNKVNALTHWYLYFPLMFFCYFFMVYDVLFQNGEDKIIRRNMPLNTKIKHWMWNQKRYLFLLFFMLLSIKLFHVWLYPFILLIAAFIFDTICQLWRNYFCQKTTQNLF